MNPKTKADCDKTILRTQERITEAKTYLATMKAQFGSNSPAANNAKISLEKLKGELAELKALRKTLK